MKKCYKKILPVLLCVIMIFGTLATGGEGFADALKSVIDAISVKASAASIDDLFYEINNGEATITKCDQSASGKLVIPDTIENCPVTRIGNWAFSNCQLLTEITIPDSVTSIGDEVFTGCNGLISITVDEGNAVYDSRNNCNAVIATATNKLLKGCDNSFIPDTVNSISSGAFSHCDGLTSITIPDSVTSIGDSAFYWCTGLTEITIPDSVTSIGRAALAQCSGLTSITVDAKNPVYHSKDNCLIETNSKTLVAGCKNSVIPDDGSVIMIGYCAFEGCWFTGITIPQSIKYLDLGAFRSCWRLESVTFSEGLEMIGETAFEHCHSLKSINIPASVTEIFCNAFAGCWELETITVEQGNSRYHSAGNCLIETNRKILVAGCKNSLIPDDGSVTSIGNFAFYECRNLRRITIPYGVTTIGVESFGVQSDGLESVIIPDSIANIDRLAFVGCFALTDVYYNGTEEQWNEIETDEEGNECLLNANIHFNIENGTCGDNLVWTFENGKLKISGEGEMIDFFFTDDQPWFAWITKPIYEVVIENGVTGIGSNAFIGGGSITSITIPDSVTGIGYSAFADCSSLADVYYTGTEEQWNEIEIDEIGNECLLNANIHFQTHTVTYIGFDGTILATFYVEEGSSIPVISNPTRENYTFKGWTPEVPTTMPASNLTFTAVFEKNPEQPVNPTVSAKLIVPSSTEVEYAATLTVKAKATDVPEGYYVALYDGNTQLAKGSNAEVSYIFPGEFTGTKNITAKIIDDNGNVQKDGNGNDLSASFEVKAKSGFFAKLIAFFKRLFKSLPAVTVEPK